MGLGAWGWGLGSWCLGLGFGFGLGLEAWSLGLGICAMHYVLCAMCYILCNMGNVYLFNGFRHFLYVLYVMCSALRDMHGAKCEYFLCLNGSSGNALGF